MLKTVFIGVQGCGKGTQAAFFVDKHDFVHISAGDLFRWNSMQHTKKAAMITRFINDGKLVPDEVVNSILLDRLAQHDQRYSVILDGYPRSLPQAEYVMTEFGIDRVVSLELPDEVVLERIEGRRIKEGRADDTPEKVKARIQDFHNVTKPVLGYFEEFGIVEHIDALGTPEEVYARVCDALKPKTHYPFADK